MTLTLRGYLRENPGGAAVSGATVDLYDQVSGLAPTTTSYTNLSGNSTTTDANGMWEFTMDLCTGPLRVQADLGGGNTRHRRSDEVFQYDGVFINRANESLRAFTDGIIDGYEDEFSVAASAPYILTISPGMALIRGMALGWDTGTKSVTGSINGSAGTTRYDFLCLRQYYAGTNVGMQDIVLVQGGSSTDPVVTTSESDLTKFIRGDNIWDLPIYRAKLAYGSTTYTLDALKDTGEYRYAGTVLERLANSLTLENDLTVNDDFVVNGDATLNGDTYLGSSGSDVIHLYGKIVSEGTSPSVGASATDVVGASGSSVSFGNDSSFEITSTAKGSPAAGTILVVTFNSARPTSNYTVVFSPRTSAAAGLTTYVTSKGTTGFTLSSTNAPTGGATLTWGFQVM